MNAYDFVHLGFLVVGGEIHGKTKLQKTMYFLGLLTDSLEELGYRAHYYGPYSEEVADAVGRLVALRFVDRNVVGGGAVNELGFEVARYDYRLNDDGRAVAERKAKRDPDFTTRLRDAAGRLRSAGDLDYMKLSVAAKTYFMLEGKKQATMGELVKQARRFGWQVTEKEVSDAGAYLARLQLVEVVAGD